MSKCKGRVFHQARPSLCLQNAPECHRWSVILAKNLPKQKKNAQNTFPKRVKIVYLQPK